MAASHRQLAPIAATTRRSTAADVFRGLAASYGILWAGTLATALVVLPFARELHPLLGLRLAPRRGISVATAIASNNAREAAIPILFALVLRVRPRLVLLGDVVVGVCLATNVAIAGLALGSYGPRLLLDLPHWPVEWAAFAVALSIWRRARTNKLDVLAFLLLSISCAMLLCVAALIETYAVPQS